MLIPIQGIPYYGIFLPLAIKGFKHKEVEEFFFGQRVPRRAGWAGAAKIVVRKLDMVHYAAVMEDLRSPPGNRLEALKGGLAGYHSVRVNDQWRVVFRWTPEGPEEVDVVDYHE